MSVHSHQAAHYEAATPEYPRHVVTAVLVSHDGARWLPDTLAGLVRQERPVQNVIAADTGSADESAQLVTEVLGPDRVLHMARRTGFGAAVDEAVRTAEVLTPDDLPYLKRPSGWDPVTRTWRDEAYDMPELPHGEPVQWLWLLHDDCAPEPDALTELLRVADASPSAGIVGPKLRGWYDRRQLLEVGVSIANSGRRWTGLDKREQDQGQHDAVRSVLSVSTAGMLIRRDVYEELAGFDRQLPLMRDDVDLCWRAHMRGYGVLVAPDAVLRHAEAAARERRPIDCVGRSAAGPHRVDKSGATYSLLVNSPGKLLPWVAFRVAIGTVLRMLAYLVGKAPGQAFDEVAGLFGVLVRPGRVIAARKRRGRPTIDPSDLRSLFPPRGATVRVTAEQLVSNFSGRWEPERSSGGRHGAVEPGPGDEDGDFLEVEQFAQLKRIAHKPAPALFAVLLLASLIACRALIGGGVLAGGALLPAPADVADLWARHFESWQPVGTGTTESEPPYIAMVATLATLLFGSTEPAMTLLLVCSVPLAGLGAYFASRPLVDSRPLRAWGSVAYAFLPAVTGALASGRIGTCVLAIALPFTARAAVAASGLRRPGAKPDWRAAWACALLLTVTTAFTPIVWPIALLLSITLLALRLRPREQRERGEQREVIIACALRCAALLVTPMVLLAPWSLSLLISPSGFLREAGLPYDTPAASAIDLLLLTPGGPGAGGGLLLGSIVLAALAALLRRDRQPAVRGAWVCALVGLLFAGLANGAGWAGPATLVYGLALLCAAAVGAEGVRRRVAEQSFGWRQPVALLIAVGAAGGPALAALGWVFGGADGPLTRRDPVQVPAFVAEEGRTSDQARTLVVDGSGSGSDTRLSYALVRGSGASLGDGELAAAVGEGSGLGPVVAKLVAGSGADQTAQLGGYAIRYVLVHDGAPRWMSRVLDTTPGLTRLSQQDGSALWRVEREIARITIVPGPAGADGEARTGGSGATASPVTVAAGPVEAHTDVPDGRQGRVLRIADAADEGWEATLDGQPLRPVTVDGWAQGFELPASGGRLDLTYETPVAHTLWVWSQGLLLLVTMVLALPDRRREIDDDLPEAGAVPTQPGPGEGRRRARRQREGTEPAGHGAAGTTTHEPGPDAGHEPATDRAPGGADGRDFPAGAGATGGTAGANSTIGMDYAPQQAQSAPGLQPGRQPGQQSGQEPYGEYGEWGTSQSPPVPYGYPPQWSGTGADATAGSGQGGAYQGFDGYDSRHQHAYDRPDGYSSYDSYGGQDAYGSHGGYHGHDGSGYGSGDGYGSSSGYGAGDGYGDGAGDGAHPEDGTNGKGSDHQ